MRIVGGKYRGKKLFSPISQNIRPTSDKAREAVFNILRSKLGNDFRRLKLIDVFSGSGAFGLEAISQGFGKVCLVDIDTNDLMKNVGLFPLEKNNISVVKADINKKIMFKDKFDVLFSDAPYNKGLSEIALNALIPYLNNEALCFIEVEKNENINLPQQFRIIEERKYGIAKLLIAEFIY